MRLFALSLSLILLLTSDLAGQSSDYQRVSEQAQEVAATVIEWRHHLHQNPELSNREFETAKYVAEHLRKMGLEVHTGVAHTGVVGVLRGKQPGRTIALRADMDALPVTERVAVPYASTKKSTYLGQEVGVMHACGHDTHVAMLMGAAQLLAARRDELQGNVVFLFQPAEEGAPPGEEGGAYLMVKEGVLEKFGVDAAFGLHINAQTPVGRVRYKPGGTLAAANRLVIKIHGKQSHGSAPWGGIDPITIAAQVIQGLQMIVSRQTELTKEAAVISIGRIDGGVRNNIIPEMVELDGTIRTLDTAMQRDVHERIHRTVTNIVEAWGATAEVTIEDGYPVTYNDPALTEQMLPTLRATVGEKEVQLSKAVTGAEDFSFFAQQVPGLFVFLGGMPPDRDPLDAAPHHTPDFYIDDSGLVHGVRLYTNVALDYLRQSHNK